MCMVADVSLEMISEQTAFFRSVDLSEVTLRVRDLERVAAFYRDVVGLRIMNADAGRVALSAGAAKKTLIVLESAPGADERKPGRRGFFTRRYCFPAGRRWGGRRGD